MRIDVQSGITAKKQGQKEQYEWCSQFYTDTRRPVHTYMAVAW
jgi:predicted small secreted protein